MYLFINHGIKTLLLTKEKTQLIISKLSKETVNVRRDESSIYLAEPISFFFMKKQRTATITLEKLR